MYKEMPLATLRSNVGGYCKMWCMKGGNLSIQETWCLISTAMFMRHVWLRSYNRGRTPPKIH